MQTNIINFFRSSFTGKNRTNGNLLNESGSALNTVNVFLLYISFSFLFLGIRLWLIKSYGNATPFWDQWDAEAATLYKPLFDGTLEWKQFIAPHNEHRIVTTRLLALVLFLLNRTWNPLLLMVVNAGLHLMVVLLLNALLIKVIGRNYLAALLAFSLALFSIPFGWENILAGFQSSFYFVLLFSLPAIWFMVISEPFSRRWWAGIALGMLAFFSLASGVFAFATGAFMSLLLYVLKLRKTKKQLLAAVVLGVLFLAGAWWTPSLETHAVYKAHSMADLYHSLKIVFSWPVGWNFLSVCIRNFPIAVFVISLLRKRPAITDARWLLFALCVWSVSQSISIAYGRALSPLSPRYRDLHIIPIFISFVCTISLVQNNIGIRRIYALTAQIGWVLIILISFGRNAFNYLPDELTDKKQKSLAEEKNTKNYIVTGNINYLRNKPEFEVPYPDPEKLASIIEMPGIRETLPYNISSPLICHSVNTIPGNSFIINGYDRTAPAGTDTVWGSYNSQGNAAIGHIALQYDIRSIDTKLEIPVAGYPLEKGMKLELEQNGQRKPIVVKENPGEAWTLAYVKVNKGPFSISLTDSSAAGWLAVGAPRIASRFDTRINNLLYQYYVFILIGIVAFIIQLILQGLKYEDKENKTNTVIPTPKPNTAKPQNNA